MADNEVPDADALEQSRSADDTDPELIDVEDDLEIGFDVPEADAVGQSRPRAVPAAVASPADPHRRLRARRDRAAPAGGR